ncbi:uncharacterized protein ENSP00000471857-like [Suncus etruscus]|uniref:uncharacterized protein ENSP00000471857-like n=1 Tax=Suncus etruscus TaxID=109475 RepID=UPI00210FB18C|nr:uncharacterized protein ENSP00000471857-like [Suncus etruscus]
MANVNPTSRPHYASSIPVPRAASQTRIPTPGASPQLRPRQSGLALSPQRAASPRLGKSGGPLRSSSPKASWGSSPKLSGGVRESGEASEGLPSSPWSSPRTAPKASLSSRTGSRRVGETQGTPGKKKVAHDVLPINQTRGRSPARTPARTPSRGEAHVSAAPDALKPLSCVGKEERDGNLGRSGFHRTLEPDDGATLGISSTNCSSGQSKQPSPVPGAIGFSAHQQSQPVMATVAPFQYRDPHFTASPGPHPQNSSAWTPRVPGEKIALAHSSPPGRPQPRPPLLLRFEPQPSASAPARSRAGRAPPADQTGGLAAGGTET